MLLMQELATGQRLASWRVPCKAWNCPKCSKKKTLEVSKRVHSVFTSSQLRFLTLTIRPMESLPSAIKHVNHSWNRLRLSITRKFGKVKYFKVLESQRGTNMPHFHILCDKYIPAAWLNRAVTRSGFGRIFKIKRVRNDQVLSYVTKYLAKGISNDDFLEALLKTHGRRYSFSRGTTPLVEPSLYKLSLFIKTNDAESIHALISHFYHRMALSSNVYPLTVTKDFSEYFIPASVPLLPAPPASVSAVRA